MQCEKCGSSIEDIWGFCPKCEIKAKEESSSSNIDSLFGEINKELDKVQIRMRKYLKNDTTIPIHKLKPSGFSIKIRSSYGKKPKINIQTFGDIKKVEIKKQSKAKKRVIPKNVMEPQTKITRFPDGLIIEINVPDVKSIEDIEVKRFEKSIEIKAYALDKLYFKILELPGNVGLKEKELDNGRLKLAFSY